MSTKKQFVRRRPVLHFQPPGSTSISAADTVASVSHLIAIQADKSALAAHTQCGARHRLRTAPLMFTNALPSL